MPGAATQSELGHGLAPGAAPRASMESESVRSGGDDTAASVTDMATLVEPSFDENILRTLCETDVSAPGPLLWRFVTDGYGLIVHLPRWIGCGWGLTYRGCMV